jgi:drug/metabolite transporter (DMT)-like permease
MGLVFGLIAALGWGAGDFMLSRIARRHGPLPTLLYVQIAGLLAIGAVILARRDVPPADPRLWAMAVGVNLLNVVGTLCLYRALAIGTVSIVSPLAACFAAVTAVLALLGGERPEPLTLIGVAVVVAGVIGASRSADGDAADRAVGAGVPAALGAALCYGVFFYLLQPVTAGLGIAWPILVGRLMTVLVATLLLAARRQPAPPPTRWAVGAALLASGLDTLGFLAYNSGIATAYVSVVTALASIFSAVTVLLAWALLRERLAASQWAGVAAVLAGVLLASV